MVKEFIDERERQAPADTRTRQPDVRNPDILQVPLGEPAIDFDVRSVYDARPINAYDFNIIPASVAIGSSTSYTISFQVKQGRTAVIRELHHWIEPVPNLPLRSDILLSIQLQKADVPDNINIPVGVASDGLIKLFLIADEYQTVSFNFVTSSLITGTGYVHVYGNYILKTGRPAPFEIANPVGGSQKRGIRGPTMPGVP